MKYTRKEKKIQLLFIFLLSISANLKAQPFFEIRVNKLWGLIDSTGKVVLKPSYDELHIIDREHNFSCARLGDSTFLLNAEFKTIARTTYAFISWTGEGMFRTEIRSKKTFLSFYGLMDSTGKIIVEPKFESISEFQDGVADVKIYTDTTSGLRRDNLKSGSIDKKGKLTLKSIKDEYEIKIWGDTYIQFYEKGKGWGLMDSKKKIIIEPKYTELVLSESGYVRYSLGKYGSGLMKRDGTITIPYDENHRVSLSPQTKTDTLVVVSNIKLIKHDLLPVKYTRHYIYTANGKLLYTLKKGWQCSDQRNGFFLISDKKSNRGMLNASLKMVVKPVYDVIQWHQPGLKQVEKNAKWGFIDNNGKEVIPCIYDDSGPFSNGLASIYVGGRWSEFISAQNKDAKMGYINKKGEIIWAPTW